MEYKHVCKECGCHCDSCVNHNSLHLHREIEDLKKQVNDRESHIQQMETNVLMDAKKFPNGEYFALQDEIGHWEEKYERLYESHKRLQKVNQGLEDKLLKIVDKYETEKNALTKDVTELTTRLVDARVTITELEDENERYRNDCNLAVQLLQCKPSNFVSHKVDSLPADLQQKVKHHLNMKRRDQSLNQNAPSDVKTIRVPIPTFPPTAMVYSVNKYVNTTSEVTSENSSSSAARCNDLVSAAIMAKVLEERAKEHNALKQNPCRCKTKTCLDGRLSEKGTQTPSRQLPDVAAHVPPCERDSNVCSSWTVFPVHGRTRTESTSSYDQASFRTWSRNGSTSSSTETQI